MNMAKMQSEREYKKGYEETKAKYNIPLDMVNVVAAKQAQDIASNVNYKQLIHNYTYLPDAMNLELSKNMMQIQSNVSNMLLCTECTQRNQAKANVTI